MSLTLCNTIAYDNRDPFRHSAVRLGGNIGNQPLLASLPWIRPNHLVVLELSSFQLEQLAPLKMAPKVALLTNLTPNHPIQTVAPAVTDSPKSGRETPQKPAWTDYPLGRSIHDEGQ